VPATGVLTFTGDVAGTMTLNSSSVCTRTLDQQAFELDLSGTGLTTDMPGDEALSGKEWTLVVDGTIGNPDAVDAGVGPTSYHLSLYLSKVTLGNTHSTVTVAPDVRSGSLNLQLKGAEPRTAAQVRVTGTFNCAFP
jgi:hypothetical protein